MLLHITEVVNSTVSQQTVTR